MSRTRQAIPSILQYPSISLDTAPYLQPHPESPSTLSDSQNIYELVCNGLTSVALWKGLSSQKAGNQLPASRNVVSSNSDVCLNSSTCPDICGEGNWDSIFAEFDHKLFLCNVMLSANEIRNVFTNLGFHCHAGSKYSSRLLNPWALTIRTGRMTRAARFKIRSVIWTASLTEQCTGLAKQSSVPCLLSFTLLLLLFSCVYCRGCLVTKWLRRFVVPP